MASSPPPVVVSVAYPERLSRSKLLLKTFLGWLYVGVPHGIILGLYGIAVTVASFIAWWVILFTGKYPKSLFDFEMGYWRWAMRVNAYFFLRDEYPPFSSKE